MSDTVAQAYIADSSSLKDNSEYQHFNIYRDIAAIYSCELIDFNEALKIALDAGESYDDIWESDPHLKPYGYETVFTPEIKKHFKLSNNQTALNLPYPLRNKEEIIYLHPALKMDLFQEDKITLSGSWSLNNSLIQTSTTGDYIEVQMDDIIGCEIQHTTSNGATIQLKKDDGAYQSPSTFTFNSRVLQYITPVKFPTGTEWVLRVPFKKGIITSNELADGTLVSGKYTIEVNSLSPVVCEMYNPSSVSLGTFTVGQAATFISGGLSFPQKYNGENNYHDSASFNVGDVYEFYIKSNWHDTISAAEGQAVKQIFGLERGNYTLKITANPGVVLNAVKLLH